MMAPFTQVCCERRKRAKHHHGSNSQMAFKVKIVRLPSSDLSSLHSEVHPSLLPTSLGGSQDDKVGIWLN